MKDHARQLLRNSVGNPYVDFREGQWESIEGILQRRRMLVVQRTGWGKSMVYFIATKLLREMGKGPTLIISPLISLMRNQLESASRIGIRARTINSSNTQEWEEIESEIRHNRVDVLLISPERLANDEFRQSILTTISSVGLFVVDEAHCISDWGHDFRPDYKRIVRILEALPINIPVLATTATANNRVVEDVAAQLGQDIEISRGPLVRESLRLQNITMQSPAARMAWMAQRIPEMEGSGIVYTLTQRDADRVTEWLQANHINAEVYHAGIEQRGSDQSRRDILEKKLLNNEIKVLVATVALGMGFDKPDLGFVIHYQRPSSVVHYYQQVGRAGRAINEAYGILLHGEEDEQITNYFIRNAFPPQVHINDILRALNNSEFGLSVPELQRVLNLKKTQIDKTIKYLTVESPSPITKFGTKWTVNPFALNYSINTGLIESITQIRNAEQTEMQIYMSYNGCLMEYLENALDDPTPQPCGKCMNCDTTGILDENYDIDLSNRAALYLKRSYQPISPRKQWPFKDMFDQEELTGFKIPIDLQASEGRALSLWRDSGWGNLVAQGKYQDNRFSDELVSACVNMIQVLAPDPSPTWVTCIPSLTHPELVPDFAKRLAVALNLPFIPAVEKVNQNSQQKDMENKYQQAKNLDGVFRVSADYNLGACLLIDDMIDSGWTFTVASVLLRRVGVASVVPIALALNSPRMD